VIYLILEDVAAINADLVGPGGLRDAGLLLSACERPKAGVYGQEAYTGTWEKAAALLQSLACNHAFMDGNKRTALLSALTFLRANGHQFDRMPDQQAAEDLVLSVIGRKLKDVQAIASALVKFYR
jgi:death-on-curing protein